MQNSNSSDFLQSRLIAESKSSNDRKPNMGSTQLKPRIFNPSKSAPFLSNSGPLPNPVSNQSILKSKSALINNVANRPSLSSSPSAIMLSANASLRMDFLSKTDKNNMKNDFEISETKDSSSNLSTLSKTYAGQRTVSNIKEPSIYEQYCVDHHGFIASLNLKPQQLHALFKEAQTFFYMTKRIDLNYGWCTTSVYDLEVISLEQVDKKNYFTLSKEGVTQFRDGESSFTNLKQYNSEYIIFHKISDIRFFKAYKTWKVSETIYFLT